MLVRDDMCDAGGSVVERRILLAVRKRERRDFGIFPGFVGGINEVVMICPGRDRAEGCAPGAKA
jgi:hypothetical protein